MNDTFQLRLPIQAILFDAFGTLVYIRNRLDPYKRLLTLATALGRRPRENDARWIMSRNIRFADLADDLGVTIPPSTLLELQEALREEIDSIECYPEVTSCLLELKQRGYKLGICSNLATPYAERVPELLPFPLDAYTWSFEAGAVKPDAQIYRAACDQLAVTPEVVLMIGDTYQADCLGPRREGMAALHLSRDRQSPDPCFLSQLGELFPLLGHR